MKTAAERALGETVLNLQRLAECIERTLRRAEERLAEVSVAEADSSADEDGSVVIMCPACGLQHTYYP